jgi:hypothetical protein
MTTMNKPAQSTPDWYQAVTDNWTTIETSLIDKAAWAAKGDLLAASGPSSPVRVAVGANNQILQAVASASAGVNWVDPTQSRLDEAMRDLSWGRKFFADEGLLPANRLFEYYGTPPPFGGWMPTSRENIWLREPGYTRPILGSGGWGWWDLGAPKTKVLLVMGAANTTTGTAQGEVFLTQTEPLEFNWNGYYADQQGVLRKYVVGQGWTEIGTYPAIGNLLGTGMAMYFNGSTNVVRYFMRFSAQWFEIMGGTDTTYTTMRYAALKVDNNSNRLITPFVCYAE